MSSQLEEIRIVGNLSSKMKERLRENDRKNWELLSAKQLRYNMLRKNAIRKLYAAIDSGDSHAIKEQCADVANWCAMIADVA